MPTKPLLRFFAWSYSRLSDYTKCPAMAKYKHLEKRPTTGSEALDRGNRIHKEAERFGTGAVTKLPDSLKLFKEEFKALTKHRKILQVEQQLAVNNRWTQANWFGKDAWLRVVLDACYQLGAEVIKVIDYKTGKIRPENTEQLSLYAPVILAHAPPTAEVVEADLWYLDQGEIVSRSFTRDEAEVAKKVWEKKAAKMLADTSFKPTPGDHCRWCDFSKAKAGPCKF